MRRFDYVPPMVEQDPDNPERMRLNISAMLVALYEVDFSESAAPERQEQIRRFKERARAALEADALSATPREMPLVLWTTFGGEELSRRFVVEGGAALDWLMRIEAPS